MNSPNIRRLSMTLAALLIFALACGGSKNSKSSSGTANANNGSGSAPASGGTEASAPAVAPKIGGEYTVKGTNPGGGEYTGELTVKERGDVFQFSWTSGSNTYDGVGVQSENSVGAAFANGSDGTGCAVAHYKIGSDGKLSGRWGQWGKNSAGAETATKSDGGSGLEGEYAVSGVRLDGRKYSGTLKITAEGSGFLFQWRSGKEASEGFGIRIGDYVSVGIGGGQCGFVGYEVRSDGSMRGKWSSFRAKAIGTEVASKK